MDFEAVKTWLEMRNDRLSARCRALGIFGLVLFPLGLAVAWGLLYGLLRLFTHDSLGPNNALKCFWIALGCLPLLFLANRLVARRDLMTERMEEGVPASFHGRRAANAVVIVSFLCWILFTGPRLLDWALQSFRKSRTLKRQDTHSCAAVLWLLLSRPRKVSFEDLRREIDWLDLETVLPQLKLISGILFLQTPPPGLALTQDLRNAIRANQVA
jgi:hypothetical protein